MDNETMIQPRQEPNIADMIRRQRRRKGLSEEALAFESNVTVSTLSRIERGTNSPTLRTLGAIAKALDINVSELVTAIEPTNQPVSVNP
jgi:transcriptional regulator with XRE-family HTH domain